MVEQMSWEVGLPASEHVPSSEHRREDNRFNVRPDRAGLLSSAEEER